MTKAGAKRIRALDRGLSVIEYLSNNGACSLSRLSGALGLSNATLLRVLATLQDRGWVRRNIVEGHYELAHSLGALLGEQARAHPLAELAAPILLEMTSRSRGMPSDLSAVTGPGRIEIVESTRLRGPLAPLRTSLGIRPSMVLSAHGRAVLAWSSDPARAAHIDSLRTSDDPRETAWIDDGRLFTELEKTRTRGFGSRDPNYWVPVGLDPGPLMGAIAVPIRTSEGVFGTISALWLQDDMSLDEVLAFGTLQDLEDAAHKVSCVIEKAGLPPPVPDKAQRAL